MVAEQPAAAAAPALLRLLVFAFVKISSLLSLVNALAHLINCYVSLSYRHSYRRPARIFHLHLSSSARNTTTLLSRSRSIFIFKSSQPLDPDLFHLFVPRTVDSRRTTLNRRPLLYFLRISTSTSKKTTTVQPPRRAIRAPVFSLSRTPCMHLSPISTDRTHTYHSHSARIHTSSFISASSHAARAPSLLLLSLCSFSQNTNTPALCLSCTALVHVCPTLALRLCHTLGSDIYLLPLPAPVARPCLRVHTMQCHTIDASCAVQNNPTRVISACLLACSRAVSLGVNMESH